MTPESMEGTGWWRVGKRNCSPKLNKARLRRPVGRTPSLQVVYSTDHLPLGV